jgi:hypothetical protein
MPRKKSTTLDKTRQSLAKGLKGTLKKGKKAVAASNRARKAARDQELLARWRILNRLGLINARKPPAAKRLTPKRIREINREYYAFNANGHYANGKVYRPFVKQEYRTPSGKARTKYVLDPHYQFIRTKQKVSRGSGVFKTKKGVIVEKRSADSKVSIRNGDIVEKKGKEKLYRKTYQGAALLKLRDDIAAGKIKWAKDGYFEYRSWGGSRTLEIMDAQSFLDVFAEYESGPLAMTPSTFNAWVENTEFYFIRT